MTGTEIYKRTPTYDRQAREIKLHAPHWKLLLAYDGLRSLSEVALTAEITFAEALPLTQNFLNEGWIEEMPITLDQYMKRIGMKDVTASGALVAPPTVIHEPKGAAAPAPAPATPPAIVTPPAPGSNPTPPPPLPGAPTLGKPVEPVPAFKLSTPAAPGLKSAGRVMKLSAVVDFITSLVGNISVGQLLVYRVFLRVPPELLIAEDVASVYLIKDTSLIKTEALQKAINDAVNAVAKRSLPDSVFAAA
jgi:hypothetical protein